MPNATKLRHVVEQATQPIGALDDATLLQRFLAHDADALEALVRSHGAMVLGVCRRRLGPTPDADDAFQATFLTLSLQAKNIRRKNSLSAWLHGVAVRCCRKAQAKRPTAPLSDPASNDDPFADVTWREVRQLLDDELERLPVSLRGPVVLCYLEGLTRDEAATRLQLSTRTLKRRLARGLKVLQARLTKRGLAPLVLAGAVCSGPTLTATVPSLLLTTTLQTLRTNALPPAVAGLVTEVSSLPWLLPAAAFVVAIIGVGLGVVWQTPISAETPLLPKPKEETPPKNDAPPTVVTKETLPQGAVASFGTARFRSGATTQTQLSPDGQWLGIASAGGVQLWDVATGEYVRTIPCFYDPNQSENTIPFAFLADHKHIVTHNGQKSRTYVLSTGEAVKSIMPLFDNRPLNADRYVAAISCIPSGEPLKKQIDPPMMLFAMTDQGGIATRNTAIGEAISLEKSIFSSGLTYLLPNGFLLNTSTEGTTVLRLNSARLNFTSQSIGVGGFNKFVLAPSGQYVMGLRKRTLQVYAMGMLPEEQGASPPIQLERTTHVQCLAFSRDHATLFVGTMDGKIRRFDRKTGRDLGTWDSHHGEPLTQLLPTPDGKMLISLGWDHVIRRWDLTTNQEIAPPSGYTRSVRATFAPDGQKIVLADEAGRLDLWDVEKQTKTTLQESGPRFRAVHWYGSTLTTLYSNDMLRTWDMTTQQLAHKQRFLGIPITTRPYHWFPDVCVSPDGKTVVRSLDRDGSACYSTATGNVLWKHSRPGASAYSPDGTIVAFGNAKDGFDVVDALTGARRHEVRMPLAVSADETDLPPWSFLSDGRLLVPLLIPAKESFFQLEQPPTLTIDRRSNVVVVQITSNAQRVCLAASPDGRWLALGEETGAFHLYEMATGYHVQRLGQQRGAITQLTFSPDGRHILSVSLDLTAALWELGKNTLPGVTSVPLAYQLSANFPGWTQLATAPDLVAQLRQSIQPPTEPTRAAFQQAIRELDDNRFAVREAATKRLTMWHHTARPALLEALQAPSSQEVTARIQTLLDAPIAPPPPDDVAAIRAVYLLELNGSAAARELLQEWAKGLPGTVLAEQAIAALRRR